MTDVAQLPYETQLELLLELAGRAVGKWDLPKGVQIALINLSENATYAVTAPDGRKWALRIHREGYHSKAAIRSELAWLRDLRDSGVVVTPQPVSGRDGHVIQVVRQSRLGPRYVVLSHWENGKEPEISQDLTGPFAVLGETAARMHLHSRKWVRTKGFTRPVWNFETALGEEAPHWGRWRDGLGVDAEKARIFGQTVAVIGRRLAAFGQGAERFGLIHCDLRLANLLVDGDTVKVIDFDDCGFSWFMYDAATPLSFYEHDRQVPDLIEAWKQGYRRIADLTEEDAAEIATFVMLRRLLLVAWIGSHAQTDLARSMGLPYTQGTVALCAAYLREFDRG